MPLRRNDIEIRVLGVVAVSIHETGIQLSPVERHIVALLVAAGSEGLDADRLADQLWPVRLPNTWRASLRNSISRLNKKVENAHRNSARLISERVSSRQLQIEDDAVDLWRLHTWARDPSQIDGVDVEADPVLLSGAPFPNCELSPLLRHTIDSAAAARQDIIDNWAKQGENLSHQLLTELRRLSLDDPYNEPLAESVTELHITTGQDRIALDFLADLQREGLLSNTLAELKQSLEQPLLPGHFERSGKRATFPRHAPSIENLSSGPFAGRNELLNDLLASAKEGRRGVLVHGDSGIGKTRVAVEAAAQLGKAGYHTSYVVADNHTFGSMQPFLDAFPELGEEIGQYLDRLGDPNTQAQCRQKVLYYLENAYAGRPLCLVVDDLQWLDDQSSALLMSLCRAQLEAGLFVIGIGRTNERTARWPGWLSELSRAELAQLKVRPLDQQGMLQIIDGKHDDIEHIAARALADNLLELSSGMPGVVHWLLNRVDIETHQISIDEVEGTGYAALINDLDSDLQRYGATGSILGLQFNIEDLSLLGGFDFDETEENIRRLHADGLVVECSIPGEYRFAHILVVEGFRQILSRHEQTKLHAEAYNRSENPVRQASHAEQAAPIIGAAKAAVTSLEAALHYFNEGNYRSTILEVQRAKRLDRDSVKLRDRVIYTEALERSGQRAGAERLAVVKDAISAGDMSTALNAAAAALPEAEVFEGDPARIKVLQMVDPNQLSIDERIRLHVQLTRQLMLIGRTDEAVEHAARIEGYAVTPNQKATAWLTQQLAAGLGRPSWSDDNSPLTSEITSEELLLQIEQAVIVGAIAAGQSKLGYEAIVDHAEATPGDRSSQPHWFSQIFLVTALTDQGRHGEAVQIANRAHKIGLQSGLRIAAGTYQAQVFMWQFHTGLHGSLYPSLLNGGPNDIAANIIFDAGVVACHFANASSESEKSEALARVKPVCERAMQSHFDVSVIGLMTDPISVLQNGRITEWANETLRPRDNSFILLGSAAGNLGPCSRLIGKLETDHRRSVALKTKAMDESDRYELALWQIITRLDLAEALGSDTKSAELTSEARELATTSWLQELWGIRVRGSSETNH